MSNWPGGLIRKTPVTPAGPFQNGAASGVWTLAEAAFWTKQGLWPIVGNAAPIGLFGGGEAQTNTIDQINIASTGNATSFGQLTQARYVLGSASSDTRGLFAGGYTSLMAPNYRTNVIDYVTIATAGNATDFGDMTVTSEGGGGAANNIRAVFATGYNVFAGAATNIINYVTIASTGNAIDFGDLSVVRTYVAAAGNSTRGLFAGGIDSSFSNRTNVIDYVTLASTGNAVDFGDLTQSVQRAAGVASSTDAFFGGGALGSGTSTPTAVVDKVTIATTGNATNFATLTSARYGPGAAASSTRAAFGGGSATATIDYFTMATGGSAVSFGSLTSAVTSLAACSSGAAGGQPTPTSAAMALFGGGTATPGGVTQAGIQYVNITTTGNAYFFGQLTTARNGLTAFASSTRGVFSGGEYGNIFKNVIDYVTIASLGNATDFGDLTANGRIDLGGASNETRGLSFAGYNASTGPGFLNVIDYVTIATTGDATDFGDTTAVNGNLAACASTTRATYAGGYDGSNAYVSIGYVTIATTGNATNFGNLSVSRFMLSSCSSATRGLFAGGRTSAGSGYASNSNIIDYVTIATTGNATDFGDLTVARAQLAAASSSTTAIFGGGQNTSGNRVDTIDYVTIASIGNATDFGDLSAAISESAGCSNVHGGL
jgi:hypothetical protein